MWNAWPICGAVQIESDHTQPHQPQPIMQTTLERQRKFPSDILPWLLMAATLALYLGTLNPWISLNNLFQVAKGTGWLDGMQSGVTAYRPVYALLTWPLHVVPARWMPLALNLISVVCTITSVGLLARSVALLPHDRTHEQRQRQKGSGAILSISAAWLPVVLAVFAFSMQLSTWENATTGASETVDLLLLAGVVACLLEFRIRERDSWLAGAAAIYGIAMTNNWLMILLLPVFITSLIWLKRADFFAPRFLLPVALWGMAGLVCFYLLLPLAHTLSGEAGPTFLQVLKMNLGSQKTVLQSFVQRVPGNILMLLAITSLLPLLLVSIKWASHFGDPSRLGTLLTTAILHFGHAAFFATCLWEAFDPAFSPRHIGFPNPALTYLGALCIGYFAGYFLLVFQPRKLEWNEQDPPWQRHLHRLSLGLVWGALFLIPAGLACKNLPQIHMTNGPALKNYAASLSDCLPPSAAVLSDDPRKLVLLEAWSERTGQTKKRLFLDTQSLPEPGYHRTLQTRHRGTFPVLTKAGQTEALTDVALLNLAVAISEKLPLYYLHPSFGYYFEAFYANPAGFAFKLERYPTNSLTGAPLSGTALAEQQKFWAERTTTLKGLLPFISPPAVGVQPGLREQLLKRLHIPFEPNATAAMLGNLYSQTLNNWGGCLQMAGKFTEAGSCFDLALLLYPDNAAARINLKFNESLLSGRTPVLESARAIEDELGKYRNLQDALRDSGSFYDPTHCFGLGLIYAQTGLYRQSAQLLERVRLLIPDNAAARFWLARLELLARAPERALKLISEIKPHGAALESAGLGKLDLLQLETMALFSANRPSQAESLLLKAIQDAPNDTNVLALVVKMSTGFRQYTNALRAVQRQLALNPNDTEALVNSGFIHIQAGQFAEAVAPLTRALTLDTNNHTAQLNRAIAYLSSGQLEPARSDYAALKKLYPKAYQVDYGLADVAWRKQDTNTAIRYYESYLANAPTNSEEFLTISNRLAQLKPRSP